MKKIILIGLIYLISFMGLIDFSEAAKIYGAIALTGGGTGALDKIDGAILNDGDIAIVVTPTTSYIHYLDADSAQAEFPPSVISPDINAGDKRWILTSPEAAGLENFDLDELKNVAAMTEAQGDILYYDGTAWTRLGAGTSGQYLQTQGTLANPQWSTISTNSISQLNSNITVTDAGDGYITFTEDGTERMRIKDGNVCIGSASFCQ